MDSEVNEYFPFDENGLYKLYDSEFQLVINIAKTNPDGLALEEQGECGFSVELNKIEELVLTEQSHYIGWDAHMEQYVIFFRLVFSTDVAEHMGILADKLSADWYPSVNPLYFIIEGKQALK